MKFVCTVFLVSTFACAAPAQSPAPGLHPPVSYEDLVGLSESYLQSGRPERALSVAKDAIQQNNARHEAHLAAARALAAHERLDESILAYEAALELGAQGHRVTLELAALYDVAKRYDEAIGVYIKHLKENPKDASSHQQLGLTYLLTDRNQDAVLSLAKAHMLAPDKKQISIDYGLALTRVGRSREAILLLLTITQADPESADAWRLLARAEATQRRWNDAIEHANQAIALNPKDVDALALRCRLRLLTGQTPGALKDCQLVNSLAPKERGYQLRTAGLLTRLGQLEEATRLIDQVAQSVPDHPAVRFRRDQVAARRGDADAEKRILTLARERSTDPEIWIEVAALARLRQDPITLEAAREALNKLGVDHGFAP